MTKSEAVELMKKDEALRMTCLSGGRMFGIDNRENFLCYTTEKTNDDTRIAPWCLMGDDLPEIDTATDWRIVE